MKNFLRLLPMFALAVFLSACATDDKSIVPISLRTKINTIYVVDNPAATEENENLQPAIIGQLSAMGFVPMVVSSSEVSPEDYVLTYSARMTGRNIKTLSYLRIEVRKGGRVVGYAFSDASTSIDKYDNTDARVHPLMYGIFEYVMGTHN